ncbi:calcium uptake protein, mitochondrial-like isoform X4 [Actinidia eriantha]|uniref:calcium uptake protein, mitochondrial-like isoform X4 n=1 Tax=Actinidia eriantha TaxID=165200 RepID=UPI002589388E|nr:calcium uptake protein, mitochondrial-like isoform X4 [Actinidia eriantha]
MHSLLRTSSPSIRRFIAPPRLCHRLISTQSNGLSFRGSGYGERVLSFADSRESDNEAEKKPKFLFGDAYQIKVFFKYEKHVRTQSPLEKITSLLSTAIESIIRILGLQVGQACF